MNVYIPLGIILVLLCLLFKDNKRATRFLFGFCFLIIFLFLAIRYEFGPDYFSYRNIYERGEHGISLSDYLKADSRIEPAFLYYLQLFPKYTLFIITNSLLWVGALFLLYKKYIDQRYLWVLLLYIFSDVNCIINNSVAMRTSMAAICFIPAFYLLLKGKKIYYVALVLLGASFHQSTLPLVLFALLPQKKLLLFNNTFIVVCGVISILIVFVGQNFVLTTMTKLAMDSVEDMSRYSGYMDRLSGSSFSFNSLMYKVLAIIPVFYLANAGRKEEDVEYIMIYKVAIITSLLVPLLGQNLLSDRFLMILTPIFIIAVIHSFKYYNSKSNIFVMVMIIFVSLYIFYNMMNTSYGTKYSVYKTIFDAPYIP